MMLEGLAASPWPSVCQWLSLVSYHDADMAEAGKGSGRLLAISIIAFVGHSWPNPGAHGHFPRVQMKGSWKLAWGC